MTRVVICVLALLLASSSLRGQDATRSEGWVVLPLEQYRALRASAFPSPPDPSVPPIEIALTRVDYDLRVAGESISGDVRLTIDVLKQVQTLLEVFFLDPIAGETSFVVSAEAPARRDGSVIVPILRVPAAERETGGIAVDVVGPGEIGNPQLRGMEVADASDLGDIVSGRESPSMAAFRFKPMAGSAPRELTLTVTRYTLQAVLVANVEEARYDALLNEDGKVLVRARYAVRNNQRSFLAVVLPPRAVLWSAALSGRPVRPGLSPSGALLLPLQKGRSGEDAPTFVVELTYLQRSEAWTDMGTAHLELPALDLPVSRSGVSLRHSPRYEVAPQPGSFRPEADPGPWSPTLRAESLASVTSTSREELDFKASEDMRRLVDRFQKEIGRTTAGIVPVQIQFPEFGSVVFLASELTAETQFPSLDLRYKLTSDH